jgi:hypothetical protein
MRYFSYFDVIFLRGKIIDMIQFEEYKFYGKTIFCIRRFKPYDFHVSSYIDYLFIVPFALLAENISRTKSMEMIHNKKMFETQYSSTMTTTNECILVTLTIWATVYIKRKTNFYNAREIRILFRNVSTTWPHIWNHWFEYRRTQLIMNQAL